MVIAGLAEQAASLRYEKWPHRGHFYFIDKLVWVVLLHANFHVGSFKFRVFTCLR